MEGIVVSLLVCVQYRQFMYKARVTTRYTPMPPKHTYLTS